MNFRDCFENVISQSSSLGHNILLLLEAFCTFWGLITALNSLIGLRGLHKGISTVYMGISDEMEVATMATDEATDEALMKRRS